ncbi:TPA: transposase, partial [Candidatus Poribacteria bacterium]|nr:transposase [Candidatus Poribacteria bacterium]
MTYSLDFRTKVFRIKEKKGLTFEQVRDQFDISIRILFRWQKKLEPTMTRNQPATKINMDRREKDIE